MIGKTLRTLKCCLLLLLCLQGAALLAQSGAPECQIASGLELSLQGNAGCIIKIDHRILIVRHQQTGKLSPPAGTAKEGETAQCTAHRETWEETGVEVRVGRLLESFDDQFHLFRCLAVDEALIRSTELPVPEAFKSEISEILFLDPTLLSNDEWRFPEQLPSIKNAFKEVSSQPEED